MKLREFVDAYDKQYEEPGKAMKGTDEKAIPNEGQDEKGNPVRGPVAVKKDICAYCGRVIDKDDKWYGDKDGKVYHAEHYDKVFGNKDDEKYGSRYPEYNDEDEEREERATAPKRKMTERKKTMAKAKEPKKETKKTPAKETKTKKK